MSQYGSKFFKNEIIPDTQYNVHFQDKCRGLNLVSRRSKHRSLCSFFEGKLSRFVRLTFLNRFSTDENFF